ncbi:hypothetical protein [Caldimonas sp. KR1-144]|uniref:hypothetical protein n=1 Tax=Caldimonas sp. KR1-144 TaxID=3400911 RepID=UPI003C024537
MSDYLKGLTCRSSADYALAAEVARQMEREEQEWIASMRAQGAKASHPNDGWVNREERSLILCYPQFDDGADVGDLVALGDPWGKAWLVQLGKKIGSREWEFEMIGLAQWDER